jgi:hypothetical protein
MKKICFAFLCFADLTMSFIPFFLYKSFFFEKFCTVMHTLFENFFSIDSKLFYVFYFFQNKINKKRETSAFHEISIFTFIEFCFC